MSERAETTRKLMKVVMRNREGPVFEGFARSVTSLNDKGVFDILPRHANFITTIKDYVIIRSSQANAGAEQRWEIEGGAVLRVYQGVVEVFLGLTKPVDF